jgi:hypothetical protein
MRIREPVEKNERRALCVLAQLSPVETHPIDFRKTMPQRRR